MRSFVDSNGTTWTVKELGIKSVLGVGSPDQESFVSLEFISSDSSQTRHITIRSRSLDKMSDQELSDLVSQAQESKQ